MSYAPPDSVVTLGTREKQRHTSKQNFESRAQHFQTKRAHRPARILPDAPTSFPIIVHCHLCWDWVWQRPQQFLSRLSHRHRVLFVETVAPDPHLVTPLAQIRRFDKWPNLTLLRLQFPIWRWSDGDWIDRQRRRLLKEALRGPLRAQFKHP